MKNQFALQSFFKILTINVLSCSFLIIIAAFINWQWIPLVLPIIFFLLISLQQSFNSVQHAIFIAVLMIFLPILSAMSILQITVIYSLYYLTTILSFDMALRMGKTLPLPDFLVPIFVLIAILLKIPTNIQFGISIAYYLTRSTAHVLLNIKNLKNK